MSSKLNSVNKTKVRCPDCGREFSDYLVKFPVTSDNSIENEVEVYMVCPLCALEQNKQDTFRREHSRKLYEEAIKENKGREKKSPLAGKDLNFQKLIKLTDEEKEKVYKAHPELLDEKN